MMEQMAIFILTFVCGAAYECGCVFWVHHSEKGNVKPAVLWSCFNASVTVIGVESFLKSPIFVLAYVMGFGTGTYFAIRLKKRLTQRDT